MKIRPRQSGFTLIELTVSAALMAMILGAAYLCLSAGVSGQRLIESRADATQSARVALALLSADLRAARALSEDIEFLGVKRLLGDVEADSLDFATHNYEPRRPGETDFCEVSYFLDKDPDSGGFTLWRRRDATLDPEPLSGGRREELARDVRGLRFEYYDGFEWFDEWGSTEARRAERDSAFDPGNLYGLPEAVRVTLWFDDAPRAAKKPALDSDKTEPSLVFQTVVRLELASVTSSASTAGSSSDNSGQSAAPPGQAPVTERRN